MPLTFRGTIYANYPGEPYHTKYVREVAAESKEDFKDYIKKESPPTVEIEFGPITRKEGA